MCDFIELQTMGKSPHENKSRVYSQTGTISLRTTIISWVFLTIIFATVLLISIYIIHTEKQNNMEVHISTLRLINLVSNLQQEYVENMNQNISHSLFLDTNALIELHNSTKQHILQIFEETEKPFTQGDAETVSTYKNQLSDKIDKSFVTLSHEQTFRRVASEDWVLANNTKQQIKKLYDEEFQAAVVNYEGRDPPEISADFHKHVTELTLSEGVVHKIVPPSPRVFSELRTILNAKYNKTLRDHVVIGIDFGERYIKAFVYANERIQQSAWFNSYVGLEEYDGKPYHLPYAISQSDSPLPIFYDLKEIIRAWNSFNISRNKLFWTFDVQEGTTDGGPSVSSPKTRIQHPVESVLAKLFQKVKKASGERFYNDAKRCVIAIPYDFTKNQRNLILEAGYAAGFHEISFLDEDISAALTLQYVNGPWSVTKNIMFLQFNQLSWQIYILEGHQSNFTRIVSVAYSEIQDVVNFCITEYCQQVECDKDTLKYNGSIEARIRWRRLYDMCQLAMVYNSIDLNDGLYTVFGVSKWPTAYISQNKTDEAVQKQVENFTHFIDATLRQRQVKLTKEKIDEVIMGGKYAHLTVVNDIISRYFDGRNLTINDVPPYKTVVFGAAVKGLELAAAAIKQNILSGTIV